MGVAEDHHIQLKPSQRDHTNTKCTSPSKRSEFIRTALDIVDNNNNGNEIMPSGEKKGEDNWFDASLSAGKQADSWGFKSFIDVSSTEIQKIEGPTKQHEAADAEVQMKDDAALLSPQSPKRRPSRRKYEN